MACLRPAFLPPAPLVTKCARRLHTLQTPLQHFPCTRIPYARLPRPSYRRFPPSPRAHSTRTPHNSSTPPGNGSPPAPGDPFDVPDGELLASSPELEQLATKSTDAPILSRVVTYNLLSPPLAAPSHFPACDPANLDTPTRLQRILTKLEGPVASRSIICLQEVSLAWSGPLHQFFASRGFHLLLAAHGSFFNGYMGEGLAFPLDLYEPLELRIQRLTDTARWPGPRKQAALARALANVSSRLRRAALALFGPLNGSRGGRRHREPWEHARARYNRFVFARLRSRTNGARICVGTYHMPCIYWSPPVMLIHSALAVSNFQRLCGDDAGVLAGDFNIKPGDSAYDMILSGDIEPSHPDYPSATPDGTPAAEWFAAPFAPMKSAYREVLGAEPDFTNYAKVEGQSMFVETLDYLFCTQTLDVVDVLRLPARDAVQGPFPNASEPSDHVMIGATLRLPAAERASRRVAPGFGTRTRK